MRSPSWKISVESAAFEPGTRPPTSVWWQVVAAHASRSPLADEDRLDDEDVGQVHPALERVVEDENVAGPEPVAVAAERAATASGNETRWSGRVSPWATIWPSASQNAVE